MKLIGLISPNLSEETLVDVYKILPQGIRIEGRALDVGTYADSEFHRVEQAFAGIVRDLASNALDFLVGGTVGDGNFKDYRRLRPAAECCCNRSPRVIRNSWPVPVLLRFRKFLKASLSP